ncbi:F-box protein 9, partial [Phenoliferia sp. Uapishka_3]
MVSQEPAPELEEALSQFRQKWLEEAEAKRNAIPIASTSTSAAHPQPSASGSPPPARTLAEGIEELSLTEPVRASKPRTAVDEYETAVVAEREGRLNEALTHYRLAFKLDSDVDKLWYRRAMATKSPPKPSTAPLPPTSPTSSASALPVKSETFRFTRELQFHPDYNSEKEHRSTAAVEAAIGKHAHVSDNQAAHPSSTNFLRTSLARSFAENPYQPPDAPTVAFPTSPTSPSDALDSLAFLQADPDGPVPFGTLPHEILILIMKQLCFTSVIPPPKIEDPSQLPGAAVARGRKKRLPPKEEKALLELEMGLEDPEVGWRTDVEALERFAKTCRAARILTLDEGLWR